MRRTARNRLSRRYALSAVTAGLAVATAIFLAGAGGAGGNPSSSDGVSAKPISARAFGPRVVEVASLPKATPRPHVPHKPRLRAPRSPLGQAGLASAKKNAPAIAPAVDGPISAPPVPRTPGPSLSGFDGMEDSDTICPPFGCQPSDQGIASNGTLVIQTVNTAVNVYDTSGTPQAGFPKSLQDFFGVPDATCDPDSDNLPFLSDPRVLYDPADHRFIAATLQVEGAFGVASDCPETSLYWVGVSATDDPTGAWNVYSVDTHLLGGDADYTLLGFNAEGIFIGGNIFDQPGFTFLGAFVLALPKALMQAGDPIGTPNGFGGFTVKDQLLDTVQPVASYGAGDGGPAGELLVSSYNTAKKAKNVVFFDFSNALGGSGPCGPTNQCISGVTLKTLNFSQPPGADNGDFCHDCVETIDTRVSATPVYMHGNVYFTHDTAVKVGKLVNANVLWGVVHPALDQTTIAGCSLCSTITTKTRIVDQGYLTYPGETDTWFGAIQPDREGNLFIGFDYQSETSLIGGSPVTPSSAYVSRRATAATGSGFDAGVLLRASTDPTFDDRWGDYSAIGFDGWESNGVWFATQYSGPDFDWATHVDELGYTSLDEQ